MEDQQPPKVSAFRLRLGIILLLLFWLPIWLLVPVFARIAGIASNASEVATLTIIIAAIQTALAVAGVLIAGKEIIPIVRHKSRKQALSEVKYLLIKGQVRPTDGSFDN